LHRALSMRLRLLIRKHLAVKKQLIVFQCHLICERLWVALE